MTAGRVTTLPPGGAEALLAEARGLALTVDEATRERARNEIEQNAQRAFEAYERMLEQGVAKEVARAVLPLSTYTKYYWSCNPRSLMHFCGLRNHESAQYEIRQYAAAAEEFLERLMPVTHAAFVANDRTAP